MDHGVGRGFDRREFEARLARAQAAMTADELDALVVTTAPNVRYFTGFNTQFWESPTRPWFVVVPREGSAIAVIPEIGAPGMAETWIEDIRTWPAPRPDDDGVSLLQATLTSPGVPMPLRALRFRLTGSGYRSWSRPRLRFVSR